MGQGESTIKGSGRTGGGSNTPNRSGGSPDGPPVFSNVTDEENRKDEENDGSTDRITNVNEAPRDESQDGDVTPDRHATFEETGLLSDDDKEMVSTFNSM